MGFNVLIGVPVGCPVRVAEELESCLRSILRSIEKVEIVQDEAAYLQELVAHKGKYTITVAVDALGDNAMYVPYLQGIQRTNPDLKIILVVPDERKGTACMEELIDFGLYNAIYQSDLNGEALYNIISAPRHLEDAAQYYGVDLSTMAGSYMLVRYGYKGNEDESGDVRNLVTRTVREGVTVTRGIGRDFGKGKGVIGREDDEMFSFYDEDEFGIDHVGTKPTKLMEFPVDEDWVETCKKAIGKFYRDKGLAELQAFEKGVYTESEFRSRVAGKMTQLKIPADKQRAVMDAFLRDLVSYGKLDAVLNTEGVSDVKLNSKDSITVQYRGEWFNTNIKFETDEEFDGFVNKICTRNFMAVTLTAAQRVFSDITTNKNAIYRISVSHRSVNTNRLTTASIRKVDKNKKLAADLINEGYWTKEEAAFLVNAVRKGKTILFTGGSGSGKTVGMNCLIEYFADNITGVCVQEAEELHSDRKVNIEFQHTVEAEGEGKKGISLKQLATQGLLKNAQAFIIGEIKGKEAEDFLTAANTGAQCMSSLHTNTVFDTLERLTDLARGAGYEQEQMLRMLARCVDIIVGLDHYKVRDIVSVVGWDEKRGDVIYDLYNFNTEEKGA